ncbi:MAG: hypothetical protein K0R88_2573 [Solirubrobacterales bacterium]|nr:hypothetical protein [Solirubrobacterales bacterium]
MKLRLLIVPAALVSAALALATAGSAAPGAGQGRDGVADARAPASTGGRALGSEFALANRCLAIVSRATGDRVVATADGYRAAPEADPARFFFKPTGLGTYMLSDQDGKLLSLGDPAAAGGAVVRSTAPGPAAEWAPALRSKRVARFRSTVDRTSLAVDHASGALVAVATDPGRSGRFELKPTGNCRRYPEASPGAAGKPFKGTNPDGTVFGFADTHLHITSEMRAGGAVVYGRSFHRFGITEALGHDAELHGADGSDDVTGNLLRDGLPFGTHDTDGWPGFAGWPVTDTNTHQQVYYGWLKRAWKAGERLVVGQTVEDQPLCEIEPRKAHSCDETEVIKAEIKRLRALERYVDAQSGGPGRGWFRIVEAPREARRVIERGRLAVVIGVESSNLFGCSELEDRSRCTRADVDRGLAKFKRWGVRSLFIAHWVDNAFAGAALEGGDKGRFINVFNRYQTGHYIRTGPCPYPGQGEEVEPLNQVEATVLSEFFPATAPIAAEPPPSYPPGPQCNAKGLTRLGAYLVRRLIDERILIEVDHLSEWARKRVLEIASRHDYPLVSGHTNTGGTWTPDELRSLYKLGGIATATPDAGPGLAAKIAALRGYQGRRHRAGVPLGTDTGGFSSLPGPRKDDAAADPLAYPFRSYDGKVSFDRQTTGERSFDLNTDGVAHYGLFADLIADMQRGDGGALATRSLFRSAEAYLRMWRRAYAAR